MKQDPIRPFPRLGRPGKRKDSQFDRTTNTSEGIPPKLLTLFRPATGELRAEPVERTTNAILHPWLKAQLLAILEQCPPAPEVVPEGRRWQDWDIYPAAEQLDRFFPPVRMLLIWDNLAGHKSPSLTQWCAEHGILLLSTPNAGSWLNMAESVQRIIKRRALQGHHVYDVEMLKDWFRERLRAGIGIPRPLSGEASDMRAVIGPTLVGIVWAVRSDDAYVLPQRIRSVRYYRRAA